jgi:signal peptidase I
MNFALILFILLVATGLVALADKLVFAKQRGEGEKEPWWIEYPKSFFPVILIVFLLRSFLVEPFRIPSGSMIPTLLVGDFILVNKFAYGIRLPIVNRKIIDVGAPERGDVMVFRYPRDPSLDYIKRVVALPGDTISYVNKRLSVNGKPYPLQPDGDYQQGLSFSKRYTETIDGKAHSILVDDQGPAVPSVEQFPFRGNCSYNNQGLTCTVPPGHYFLMGDNRDNSADSRSWGFVPDANIVGKAFFIWFNFSEPSRFGSFR